MTTITHPPETSNGVVTSWLPVTTAWPSIQQCSAAIYSQIGGGVVLAFDPWYGKFIDTQLTCLPPAATLWWSQDLQSLSFTVTSLGPFECPQLYTTGTTSVLNSMSTFVACCPSDYAFQVISAPGTIGQCLSPLVAGQGFTFMSHNTSQGASWVEATTSITTEGSNVYGIQLNGYIFAPTISATSPNLNSLAATTGISDTSSSVITTPAPTFMSSTGDSTAATATSLSQATTPVQNRMTSVEVVGVGVGVALAVVGLCALIIGVLLIRRHRLNANAERATTVSPVLRRKTWVESFTGNPQSGQRFEMSATPKEI